MGPQGQDDLWQKVLGGGLPVPDPRQWLSWDPAYRYYGNSGMIWWGFDG